MDVLSRILESLRFNSSFYFATNFHSPWAVKVPHYKNVARFHYVTQGICWVRIAGVSEPQLLSSGDLIVIPHGADHILSDTADREPISLDEAFERVNYTGEGTFQIGEAISPHDTQLVCGHFEFSEQFVHPLVSHLPPLIVQKESNGTEFSWLKDTLKFLSHTAKAQHDGSTAIIKRLSEVIFIQTIRFWSKQQATKRGFVAALNDKKLANGLRIFHENYAENWTVEKLAQESNMSRSLFADRFKYYLDISPMQYVTQWRMQNAKQMLVESDLSLDGIAHKIGYESGAAFSKAFKRLFDINPGEFRKLSAEEKVILTNSESNSEKEFRSI